jgi:hypothetical protein
MGMFEDRFRRKFQRQANGYLFRETNGDVLFSEAEVEALVEQWRLYWATPLFWIGWFALGVMAPAALWSLDYDGFGIVLVVTINTMMIVLLIHGERLPDGAAQTRLAKGEGVPANRRYTPEEYDQAMEEQRHAWRKPRNLAYAFIFFIVLPAALYADDQRVLAALVGAVSLVIVIAGWIRAHRAPAEAARRRERGEPEPERPGRQSIWNLAFAALYFSFVLWTMFHGPTTDFYYSRWLMIPLILVYLWQLAMHLRGAGELRLA